MFGRRKPKTVTFTKRTPIFFGLGGVRIERKAVKNPVKPKAWNKLTSKGFVPPKKPSESHYGWRYALFPTVCFYDD